MEKQTAGRKNLGELAPKFAELNDDVLFGEIRRYSCNTSKCKTLAWC